MKIILLIAAVVTVIGCARTSEKAPSETASASPRITQFYANTPVVPKGEAALLCYGVENTKSVSLDPPVEQLNPALTRCFEVKPDKTTTYTLTAENDGGQAKQSVTVTLGGARPKLYDLSINKTKVAPGEQVSFCFQSNNAVKVSGSPGEFLKKGNPKSDCLMHKPEKTTTYQITVSGPEGLTDSASQTVTVQ